VYTAIVCAAVEVNVIRSGFRTEITVFVLVRGLVVRETLPRLTRFLRDLLSMWFITGVR